MMTSNFPLLKLPLIPLELIIGKLDFLDLLQIAMKSSKFKRLLELLKLSIQTLTISLTKRSYEIKILQDRNSFYIDVCDSVPLGTNMELANIQGEPVEIWKHGRIVMGVKSNESKTATLETITKYILSISKVANYSLIYDDTKTEIRSLFIWQITTKLERVNVIPDNGVDLVQISPEDLTFLLEEISVADLHLNVYCPGFKYQKPIKHPVIFGQSPRWVDFDMFSFAPNIEHAIFLNQKVSDDVLNGLIKDWAEEKYPKLREVLFTWTDSGPEAVTMAREQQAPHSRTILPNRNVEQLKGRCINHLIERKIYSDYVFYKVQLSVWDDFGLNGIHLDDQA